MTLPNLEQTVASDQFTHSDSQMCETIIHPTLGEIQIGVEIMFTFRNNQEQSPLATCLAISLRDLEGANVENSIGTISSLYIKHTQEYTFSKFTGIKLQIFNPSFNKRNGPAHASATIQIVNDFGEVLVPERTLTFRMPEPLALA